MLSTWRVEAATPTVASLRPSGSKDVGKPEMIQQRVTKTMKIEPYKHISSRKSLRVVSLFIPASRTPRALSKGVVQLLSEEYGRS